MVMEKWDDADPEGLRAMFSPALVDEQIRSAVKFCWMMLPVDKRNVPAVSAEIHRILDRVLQNLAEDSEHFGWESS